MKPSARRWSCLPLALAAIAFSPLALAQAPQPPAPPRPGGPAPGPAAPAPAEDVVAAALAPKPGGLTADDVARTVAKTKHSVRAKQQDLKVAAARVDQAFVGFFPRVSLSAAYQRNSAVPTLGSGAGLIVDATPSDLSANKVSSANNLLVYAIPAAPLNSYSFQASLSVPVSDYVLRISQNYAVASHNEKAKRFDLDAEVLQSQTDGKIAYFNWVRSRGQGVVARQAVDQAKAHVEDAKKTFNAGLISRADVLRLEAQVASAQQTVAEADSMTAVAGEQIRILLQAPPDAPLEIGTDVINIAAAPPAESLATAQEQALQRRLEIRALDETVFSLKQAESLAKAGYFPRIDAFADGVYANPNPRYFPALNQFDFTWDLGIRLSWTINDTFTTIGAAAEAKARAASVAEQRLALQDGLRTEVASAHADAVKAPIVLEAAERGLASAEESYRVRRELFKAGKATGVDLVDAEGEVTRARLARLDAHIAILVARARLDHATGRDAPNAAQGPEGPRNDGRAAPRQVGSAR